MALRKEPPGDIRRALYHVMEWLGPDYEVELRGLKLRCRVNDNLSESKLVIDPRFHDGGLDHIVSCLVPGDTFVDIGANCGIYSVCAARAVGPSGIVLAIEPNPVLLGRLRTNVALNDLRNVRVAETATGEVGGTIEIFVLPKQLHRSSVHRRLVQEKRDPEAVPIKVPMSTLPEVLATHGIERVDGLKIDIEGHEDRTLAPLLETKHQAWWPKRVLIEIINRSCWQYDCVAHLQELGYRIAWQTKHDALLVRT